MPAPIATVSYTTFRGFPSPYGGIATQVDVTFEWRGEHYGCRFNQMVNVEEERMRFMARRLKLEAIGE